MNHGNLLHHMVFMSKKKAKMRHTWRSTLVLYRLINKHNMIKQCRGVSFARRLIKCFMPSSNDVFPAHIAKKVLKQLHMGLIHWRLKFPFGNWKFIKATMLFGKKIVNGQGGSVAVKWRGKRFLKALAKKTILTLQIFLPSPQLHRDFMSSSASLFKSYSLWTGNPVFYSEIRKEQRGWT